MDRTLEIISPTYNYSSRILPNFNIPNELDCSKLIALRNNATSSYRYSLYGLPNDGVNCGNYTNIGKGFTEPSRVIITPSAFENSGVTQEKIDYIKRFIRNSLYDVTPKGFTCMLDIYSSFYNQLDASDIAIATNKG